MPKLLLVMGPMLLLVILPVGYFLSGPYLDRRAIHEASEFCSLISTGETVSSLMNKARGQSVALEVVAFRRGVGERYTAWFSGFLLNQAYCEIAVVDQRVTAKFVEEAFW